MALCLQLQWTDWTEIGPVLLLRSSSYFLISFPAHPFKCGHISLLCSSACSRSLFSAAIKKTGSSGPRCEDWLCPLILKKLFGFCQHYTFILVMTKLPLRLEWLLIGLFSMSYLAQYLTLLMVIIISHSTNIYEVPTRCQTVFWVVELYRKNNFLAFIKLTNYYYH